MASNHWCHRVGYDWATEQRIQQQYSGSIGKESEHSAVDPGLIPRSERSPGVGNGNSSKYFAWRILMDRKPGRLQSTGPQRVRHTWAAERTHGGCQLLDETLHLGLHFPSCKPRGWWWFSLKEQRCLFPSVSSLGSAWAQFTPQVEVWGPPLNTLLDIQLWVLVLGLYHGILCVGREQNPGHELPLLWGLRGLVGKVLGEGDRRVPCVWTPGKWPTRAQDNCQSCLHGSPSLTQHFISCLPLPWCSPCRGACRNVPYCLTHSGLS